MRWAKGATALLGACATIAMGAMPASADHGQLVDMTRVQVDCRQAGGNVTPFMEMDLALTWDAAAATFTGNVFNVPRSGGQRQQVGTISGKTTSTTISFKISESLTHDATGALPALPTSATGPRPTPFSAKLSGPVTVTGRTGDRFACTWTADARLSALGHPVAAATQATTTAARTLGPAPAPTAPASLSDAPVLPLALGGAAVLVAGGLLLSRTLRSAGPTSSTVSPAERDVPRRPRYQDEAVKPIVVDAVGDTPSADVLKDRDRIGRLANIERRVEAAQRDAGLHDLDGVVAGAGEIGATVIGVAADTGVSTLKEFTGTPGKIVDATYTGLKGTAGALAEGKDAASAVGQGMTDVLKGQVSDKAQDLAKGIRAVVKKTPSIEVPDAAKDALGKFAQDIGSGGAKAGAGIANYVGGQISGEATGDVTQSGIDEIAKRTGMSDGTKTKD